ncbi:MAG: hypothetical protein GTN76_07925 [Candidatus Aenigmarchaeota archaeon]|nr:hypothetical protein [Candidatus Aenigmarchaeota archaeon]
MKPQNPENDTIEFRNDMETLKELKRKNPYPTIHDVDSELTSALYTPEKGIKWDDVGSVVVNLDSIKILKVLEPIWDRNAEIYAITMVNDDLTFENKSEENPTNVHSFGIFDKVKKNDTINLKNYPIYTYKCAEKGVTPEQLVCKFLIMESDQKDREIGDILEHIREREEYKRAVDILRKYPKPEVSMITIVTDLVFSAITKALETNKDDQVMLSYDGFHKWINKLGFGRHRDRNRNAILNYSIHLPPYYIVKAMEQNDIPIIGKDKKYHK